MGTNDIHGAFFPKEIEIPNPKDEIKKYKSGGLIYMGKSISILQENKLCKLSGNCRIIHRSARIDMYNYPDSPALTRM